MQCLKYISEPALDIEEAFSKDESLKETPVNKAKDVVDITPCTDIGQAELALPWSIIKLGSEVKDSSKMLNMLTVEGECGITVKPVETVEMYSKEDIYGRYTYALRYVKNKSTVQLHKHFGLGVLFKKVWQHSLVAFRLVAINGY